MTGVKRN